MTSEFSKITTVGLGYIGLPTSAVMAANGMDVVGFDTDLETVNSVNAGNTHVLEPELAELVRDAVDSGKLRASSKVTPSDAFVIAVPTPINAADRSANVNYIKSAAESIAPVLERGNLIVLESTSPVGTTSQLAHWLFQLRPDLSFPHKVGNAACIQIAYCPERVLPGHIVREITTNDRIIGGLSEKCTLRATALYKQFVRGECVGTTASVAELCKLAENSYRDVNIAIANELSIVAETLNVDIWETIELANRHPRVNILRPGPGVGGHCIAVDPWFLVNSAPENTPLIRSARMVNDSKPHFVVSRIMEKIEGMPDANIACLGITFKANVDDTRESPAIEVVRALSERHRGQVMVVEPNIEHLPEQLRHKPNIVKCTLREAIDTAEVFVGLVDHSEFKSLDTSALKDKIVVDSTGMWVNNGKDR